MEDPVLFALTVLAILAMPGPTNTLLATASATVGIRRASRLVVAEGIAYLIAILVMRLSFGLLVTVFPMAGTAYRVLVCIYLVWIAWSLLHWAGPKAGQEPAIITFRRVFLVTLLNPKAIVFAFNVITFGVPYPSRYLGVFSLLTAGVAVVWISGGVMMGQAAKSAGRTNVIPRVNAAVIGTFAVLRNVSTTLIQPGLEFRLGWSGRLCGIELSEAAGFLV